MEKQKFNLTLQNELSNLNEEFFKEYLGYDQ